MPTRGKARSNIAKSSSSQSIQHGGITAKQIPKPFSKPSEGLNPFLPNLEPEHVYITSIDSTPWQLKAKVFAVPALLNICIVLYFLYRSYTVGPYYMKVLLSGMGYPNETTVDRLSLSTREFVLEIVTRVATVSFDMFLYLVVWPWPSAFFMEGEHGAPTSWRLYLGFSDKEITIRRSRKWDEAIGDVVSESEKQNSVLLTTVRQATSSIWMHDRTAYTMMNSCWDLDWSLMVLATDMVTDKKLTMDAFKTTVLVHHKTLGWLELNLTESSGSKREEEGRKKIIAFKDELTSMGKENLFFRWIELIQYESTQPGGFTRERQVVAMSKAKEMFEAQGVDFDAFWAKIGGMEGLPGMD